jgi:N6-L-threonylcarbamoyladenine synthase
MKILGIETSCDETSAAVVEDGMTVLSCSTASSMKDFTFTGGVIPEEAARRQLETILPTIERALEEAKISLSDVDAIAVTVCPGLLGSLLVGTMTTRTLAHLSGKPLIPVHHILGHLDSVWLVTKDDMPQFPTLTLSVSGGHSDVWLRESHTKGKRLGTTLDDAAGEAFDKGAEMLGLPYPGGPSLSKLAAEGDENAYEFPVPLSKHSTMDFSFSGLKTSLKYLLRDAGGKVALSHEELASIAASYQKCIVRHLASRIEQALDAHPEVKEIHVVGGVSANTRLREELTRLAAAHSILLRYPQTLRYCTDNAAMIAGAAYFLAQENPRVTNTAWKTEAQKPL